jgi:hypothetical protein
MSSYHPLLVEKTNETFIGSRRSDLQIANLLASEGRFASLPIAPTVAAVRRQSRLSRFDIAMGLG